MRFTADFHKQALSVTGILGNVKQQVQKSLQESVILVEKNIKKELNSPNKTGTLNTRRKSVGGSIRRRSASGESLSKDTGASEKLISFDVHGSYAEVGFKTNPKGYNYVDFQERERNRPTMQLAINKSLAQIERIFEKNLTPK